MTKDTTKKIKRTPVKSPKKAGKGRVTAKKAREKAVKKDLAINEFKRVQNRLEAEVTRDFNNVEIINAKGELAIKAAPPTQGKRADGEIIPPDMIDEDGDINSDYLRYAAGLYFTLSIEGVSIEEMANHPVYGQASITMLKRWKAADNWHARRLSNLERWKSAVEKKIGGKLVQARVEALDNLKNVYNKALEHLENAHLEPKSWEGVAKVAIQTAETMVGIQDKIAEQVNPASDQINEISGAGSRIPVKDILSESEAFEAAQVILSLRRKETEGSDAEPVESERPADPLTLLQGGKHDTG